MPSSSSLCSRAAIRRSRLDGAGVGLNNGVAVVVLAIVAAALAPAEATTGRGNGGAGHAAPADADTAAGAAGIAVGVGWRDADTGASAAAEELSPTNAWLLLASAAMAHVSGGSVGAAVAAPQVTILLLCCLFCLLKINALVPFEFQFSKSQPESPAANFAELPLNRTNIMPNMMAGAHHISTLSTCNRQIPCPASAPSRCPPSPPSSASVGSTSAVASRAIGWTTDRPARPICPPRESSW